MTRPVTTLFLLMTVDGKISTGATDNWDVDKDIPNIPGDPSKGLHQYYEEEGRTDLFCLNSGRVMKKVGMNERDPKSIKDSDKTPVYFVVIDNDHLNAKGCTYLATMHKELIIVTRNKQHPGIKAGLPNIHFLFYSGELDPKWMFEQLYSEYECKEITVQTGSSLTGLFLRDHLIDKLNIIVTPILVGGEDTKTLVGGPNTKSLSDIGILKLKKINILKNSYIQMLYDVVNSNSKMSNTVKV